MSFSAMMVAMAMVGQSEAVEPAIVQPDLAPSAAVSFEVRTDKSRRAISPLIYGVNGGDFSTARFRRLGFNRAGGNRLTAYNWETNASNAGSDYLNQNDDYLSSSNVPGAAFTGEIQQTLKAGASFVMTVPMAGYVAADKNGGGDVNQTPDFIHVRFDQSLPRKGSAFTATPDLTDGKVYQDEFVHFLKMKFPGAFTGQTARIAFMLDNEPDLWAYTHRRLRGSTYGSDGAKVTYAELFARTKAYASAIKEVAPNALVFGPVNYGWEGYLSLQDASDANGRDFLATYLSQMKKEENKTGRRIVDVLDLHWYPEAQSSDDIRVTEANNSASVVQARVQAPRSLYDPDYVEKSWISQYSVPGGTIDLIPRLMSKISANYPGTRLSFSEYNYGGGDHISGGVATADVLGIFGRQGVYAANMWPLHANEDFTYAALAMYRNFDGAGAAFGDTSVKATTSDGVNTAVYAAVSSADPSRLVVVMINRSDAAVTTSTRLFASAAYAKAHIYRLHGAVAKPKDQGLVDVVGNTLSLTLPAYSVTTALLVK